MRRLLPEPAARIDPFEEYGRVTGPWLRVGMVLSADGSVTDEQGWSDGLGGAADFAVFRTLRALADAIVVGAATVRTGRVGPARLRDDLRPRRAALGKRGPAPIVVVTRRAELDWRLPLFTAAQTPTLVVTARSAAAAVPAHVPVIAVAETGEGLDLAEAVHRLREEHGLAHLLCEGGPHLAAALLRAGLVDELCLNVAPTLIGGRHHTRLLADLDARVELRLSAVYTAEDVLFLRYLTRR
ncbi:MULTISPECIES: dihydrofolate reductase family protein [Thermomonospora]|uniref:Bifunctional deaminase-reductase domain protein n=1 Tax=Thermomonospora curvata (strain ATCC 19995 / DSM 43183 / JCM 3096 / KCTC 9072 / NBRC 15933 / NCIMB 10081 / Henssen B9) TaxID=471852 RepID=D1AC78_THECD|nr:MULTISPECIES: dihydrofolate reductase family protein [Thermomonospora]ACY97344.1 bifunctional deaminase-reductase domain protein [Thermomonospora curvata DSM 43183]PKK14707.1 MAG: deaminase [Thermomonospora sp. CIF 1]